MSPAYRPAPERFWEKVEKTESCWFWIGFRDAHGYGRFWAGDRNVNSHRWAYEQERGPITAGLELDHLCRNPGCVRPDHLEAVTHSVNVSRAVMPWGLKTHCIRGHEFTPENTRVKANGERNCRACHRIHALAHFHRKKAA